MHLRTASVRASHPVHAALLAGVSGLALLAHGGPAAAGCLACAVNTATSSATAAATAAAVTSVQQAAAVTQQSMTSLTRSIQAIQAMQAAQAAARSAALAKPGAVPNGLGPGGLVVAPNAGDPAVWEGANLPTQSTGGGLTTVTIQQTAPKAILTWSSFNVGANTQVYFNQSAGNSAAGNTWIALNRVVDPSGIPSQILGSIRAEGTVYLINQNGIIFGGGSQVNVSSLVASSLNLFSNDLATSNSRFLNGGIGDLNPSNFATDSIMLTTNNSNAGNIAIAPGASITLGAGGLAVIAAPNVTNGGTITVPSGQVALIAGIGVSYDYNLSSLNPFGAAGELQGFNDNSTTNLRFANYGELTDASGRDITPVGTLTNNGLILTPRGNITLLGGAVHQDGVAVTTTSTQSPGSIVIESLYEVGVRPGEASPTVDPADELDTTFYTGSVTIGPQAVTAILPDTNGATIASDAASLAPFKVPLPSATFTTPLPTQGFGIVNIIGQAIDFQSGTLVYAPGQSIAANTVVLADPRPAVPAVPGAGRILLEGGAVIDVSGIPDTQLPSAYNLLTVTLGGNELADSSVQQDSFLFGQSVTVDMRLSGTNSETGESWVGTPLANLSGYLNLVQQSIGQLLVNGGTISFQSNEFVGAPGSTLNLMGGYVEYLGGLANTTALIGSDGRVYNIGSANPNLTYLGIAGQFTVNHNLGGVHDDALTQVYSSPLFAGINEPDYFQGGNAGALNVAVDGGVTGSGAVVLQSSLLARSVAGIRQIASGVLPSNATFDFTGILPIEIGDPGVLSAASRSAASLPAGFSAVAPLLASPSSIYTTNVFDSNVLDSAAFRNISLTTGGGSGSAFGPQPITEDAGTALAVQPGGSLSFNGARTTINGTLTAHAGWITIGTTAGEPDSGTGIADDIVVGRGAVLDVSGLFRNESRSLGDQQRGLPQFTATVNGTTFAWTAVDGGWISLVAGDGAFFDQFTGVLFPDTSGNVVLARGSLLNLQGGGRVLANGQLQTDSNGVPIGTGGNLTLETYAEVGKPPTRDMLPTHGSLILDGTINALGFNGGGTLTLQAVALQIGGDPAAAPSDAVYFDATAWGDRGFAGFNLSSVLQSEVPAGAIVRLTHANLLPDLGAIENAPTGSDPAAHSTVGHLTGTQRSPTSLSVTAGLEEQGNSLVTGLAPSGNDAAMLDAGARIIADPGASISIGSTTMTTIDGVITAPGGTISLSVTVAAGIGPVYGPLYIGSKAVLDVAGTTVINPLAVPVLTAQGVELPTAGNILGGGTINLSENNDTAILVAPGAILNVSGAAGAFESTESGSATTLGQLPALSRQPVWSAAGTINISSNSGLVFEGTLIGQPGGQQAEGGTLSITQGLTENASIQRLILVEDTAAALMAASANFNFATYVPGTIPSNTVFKIDPNDPNISNGYMFFGADSLAGSGFSSLALTDMVSPLVYGGQVSLTLGRSFTWSGTGLIATKLGDFIAVDLSAGNTTGGASLSVTAPYISLTGIGSNSGVQPAAFDGPATDAGLTLHATRQLDLAAFFGFANVGQATLVSDGDIRLLPGQFAPQGGTQLDGYLTTGANLTFEAADIYPATDTAFVIQTTGTVTFRYPAGVAPSMTTPLSANGTLLVDAASIDQGGEIQAPFGSIILGISATEASLQTAIGSALGGFSERYLAATNTTSVVLEPGSITSVSAKGAVIPFGSTVDQTTWIYNPQLNNPSWDDGTQQVAFTYPLTATPQGVVTLAANDISFNSGAIVDLSGGGTLYAQEWVPGTGGSRNVLLQFQTSFLNSTSGQQVPTYPDTRQIFAIVPGYASAVAPYDATLSQSGLAAGEAVYLAGGNGLAAGAYTLLPAQYATLPGAYRVVVNSGVVSPPTQTFTLADGTMEITGYLTDALTGARPPQTQQFYVQPASVWGRYSQYALTDASSFFPAYAAANGLAPPVVPADSGRLVIEARNDLVLNGTVLGQPGPGGFGGAVDISGQFPLLVTDNNSGTSSLSASPLDFSAATTDTLVTGATIFLSGTLGSSDIFTITGPNGASVGTLNVPSGSAADLVWTSGRGLETLNNQSVVLGNGDSFEAEGGTIAVTTQGADIVRLSTGQRLTLPVLSATGVTLPSASSTFTYSSTSGTGGNTITISSSVEFSVGGASVSFNPVTRLFTTTTYAAGQTVQGTAAGQVITWTLGSSGNTGTGAGGNLQFTGSGTLNLNLAPALTNGTVSYNLGVLGAAVTALSPQDMLTGQFLLSGNTPSAVIYAPGSYSVLSGQAFTRFTGTTPVTFTASISDQVAYAGSDQNVSLPVTQTYLQVSAKQLDSLNATSLLIGGVRSQTSVGEVITPTANGIIVSNDSSAPLTAPEILFVAAPQLASTTITLDSQSDTATISTPLAGTGQVVFDPGSVVQAQGAVAAGEPTTIFVGSTLATLPTLPDTLLVSTIKGGSTATLLATYYADIDAALGTVVRLANGAAVNLVLPSSAQLHPDAVAVTDNVTTSNPSSTFNLPSLAGVGGAVISSGGTLIGGNVLTIASTGNVQLQPGALLSGTNISLNSNQITFTGSGTAPAGATVIDPVIWTALQNSASVDLQSASTIAFVGDVVIAMANGALTLGAGSFTSDGGRVSIDAASLTLDNERNASALAATGGSGTLAIDVGELTFGSGDKSLEGFGSISLTATRGVLGEGSGTFDFGALPVRLATPVIIADTGSTQKLTTTNSFRIDAIAGPPLASSAVGGQITLVGGTLDAGAPILAPAGNVALEATTGDLVLAAGTVVQTTAVSRQFFDVTEYAPAGNIALTADAGSVVVAPGTTLDFSATAAGGGAAGSLTISAPRGTVALDGALNGGAAPGNAGGSFKLDAGGFSLVSAVNSLDALAKALAAAGVNDSVVVQTGSGVSLTGMLNANLVSLTANGSVTVTGAIIATGTSASVGEIDLYGTAGVDVEGTLTATGSPNSQKPGGVINIGTSGTGSTTSLNATYGYENVDPATSGIITIGANARIDASGGTITLRAPILDSDNAQGMNVNISLPASFAPGKGVFGGTVNLDAYAVWSSADKSTNPDQHFDGYIDPAGWYDSSGNLVSGTFTDLQGNVVFNYAAGSMTAAQLTPFLANDYFTPRTGAYNAAHTVFYGGYDPNTETFNPSAPDAGSLPAFVQQPGFRLGNTLPGVANFMARPEIDLVNPSPGNGGVNGGDITVLTNWNLGAGVTNADASVTLAYRYQGTIAPVISLRAAGNLNVQASITDGFFQGGPVSLPSGLVPTITPQETFDFDESLFASYDNAAAVTAIQFADFTFGNTFVSFDPNARLTAPLKGQSPTYYLNWFDYFEDLRGWAGFALGDQGFYDFVTLPPPPAAPTLSDPTAYAAAYAQFLTAYQTWANTAYPAAPNPNSLSSYSAYLGAYQAWLRANFSVTTPVAPTPPADQSQYSTYLGAWTSYANFLFITFDANFNSQYIYAPIPPNVLAGTLTFPAFQTSPAAGNLPANMPSATNPLPLALATLMGSASSSYRIVAGADLTSANPLAVTAPGSIALSGHIAYADPGEQQLILAPTAIRTGTGDIDIAASGDISFTDTAAPAVIYTAGRPATGMAAGSGVIYVGATNNGTQSLLLADAVNPTGGGNVSITAGGNITGIEQVYDTTGTVSGSTLQNHVLGTGGFIGQFWVQWLLTNPQSTNVPWYVNFSSFDQGVMSIGGNVTITAQGNISDLAASLPTTGFLDSGDRLHVTGGGVLSVTAGGNILSGDFYVGQGAGTITAGGAVASDFNYVPVNDPLNSYPVATVLGVQFGTVAISSRLSADIGGVYDPTYLFPSATATQVPVATLADGSQADLVPFITTMSTTSGASVRATSGLVTFNSLLAQGDLFSGGVQHGNLNDDSRPFFGAYITSLLLPASLDLVAFDGSITIDHGGGLYPSATGTLSLIANQSIDLGVALMTGSSFGGGVLSGPPEFDEAGNVFGFSLGKLDFPVGTGILPTATNPALVPVYDLAPTQTNDPSLVQSNPSNLVHIYAANGSIVDGVQVTASDGKVEEIVYTDSFSVDLPLNVAVGGTVDQISLIPNAPAQIHAGRDITDLPFYGMNFTAADITSIIAGGTISYNFDGDGQSPIIQLAGPGTLDVVAGANISFESQRVQGVNETGIRTIGNSIDSTAFPVLFSNAPSNSSVIPYDTTTLLSDFGNPYLPNGGASVNVLVGVGPGMNTGGFISAYVDPGTSGVVGAAYSGDLVNFVRQYRSDAGTPIVGSLSPARAWAIFQTLPASQQQLLVEQVFFDVLNTTGVDYNNPSSPAFHQYTAGYQAINTLFPASLGYTTNALGSVNGANQLVDTGTLDLRGSTIQTQQGGNISILGPGGRILVGSADAAPAVNPASEGILTLEKGNIDVFVDQSVLVAQSRIMTEQGGDIVMWSSNGDIDAGEGAKTSVSAPPPVFACDIDFICSADVKGQVSGAGIATLQSLPGVPTGDANLMAPRGTINAGAAGIRVSGNLNIAALLVVNAFNIQVQGVTIGIPTVTTPSVGALTAASTTAGATQAAVQAPANASANVATSVVIVEVVGYGGGDGNTREQPQDDQRRRTPPQPQSYDRHQDPNSPVQVIGGGKLTPEQQQSLTATELKNFNAP